MNYKRTKFSAGLCLPGCLLQMAALVLALTCGCSTTRPTEDLLKEAGFKPQPATTEKQQAHLKSLPAGKISSVHRKGTQYFVYPDVKHNVLYVGQSADYQRYLKLRQERELALEQTTPAELIQIDLDEWPDW